MLDLQSQQAELEAKLEQMREKKSEQENKRKAQIASAKLEKVEADKRLAEQEKELEAVAGEAKELTDKITKMGVQNQSTIAKRDRLQREVAERENEIAK